ncbi:hypothetical protein BJ912DRAFT_924473 [Pholiota molesta]|nr:hypothetical protein BJ912DRAFT_924473 [Pholiota molesta]
MGTNPYRSRYKFLSKKYPWVWVQVIHGLTHVQPYVGVMVIGTEANGAAVPTRDDEGIGEWDNEGKTQVFHPSPSIPMQAMTITSPLPPSLAHGHDKQGTLVEAGALVHFQLDKGTMGLVWSGLLPIFGITKTKTGPGQSQDCKRPTKTDIDWFTSVLGSPATKKTGLNQS